jgi:hypothetical protein
LEFSPGKREGWREIERVREHERGPEGGRPGKGMVEDAADETARRGGRGREEEGGGWAMGEPPEAKAVQERSK